MDCMAYSCNRVVMWATYEFILIVQPDVRRGDLASLYLICALQDPGRPWQTLVDPGILCFFFSNSRLSSSLYWFYGARK